MQKHRQWSRRAGRAVSVLYLLIFTCFEIYSAVGTALDKSPSFPGGEHLSGWVLLVLPGTLLTSLFLLHARRPKLGFAMIIANLCLYASFIIFGSVAFGATPVSSRAAWEVSGIWMPLFLWPFLLHDFWRRKP